MKKKTSKKRYKHLNYNERLDIEAELKAGSDLSAIALKLGRSNASIAREM
jgi:IS30 family transposase